MYQFFTKLFITALVCLCVSLLAIGWTDPTCSDTTKVVEVLFVLGSIAVGIVAVLGLIWTA